MNFNLLSSSILSVLGFTCLVSIHQAEKLSGLTRSATCPLLLPEHESVRHSRSSRLHRKPERSLSTSHRDSRVYNGDLAVSDLYNYIVKIYNSSTTEYCTGVRIGPGLALSSASCINGSDFVYLGRGSTEQREIIAVGLDENYFSLTNNDRFEHNIGLVRYAGESSSSKTMRVSISSSLPVPGSPVRIAGLGYIIPDTNGNRDLDIYVVDLPVDRESSCQDKINDVGIPITVDYDRQVCAGYGDKNCGICAGDVGAPMFQYCRIKGI